MKCLWMFLVCLPLLSQNCIPPAPLNPNDLRAGELTASSCQLSDSTHVSEFRLIAPVRGTLRISAKSSVFTPSILIRDTEGRKVAFGASIAQYVEAGPYRVLVNGSGIGKFTLTSTFQPEPNVLCVSFGHLGAGQTVVGQLASTSCKLPDGSFFDSWLTTVYGAGTLTVTMRASAFDSFLMLRGEDGGLLATDDNGGGGKDAQITLAVSGRETYSIVAGAAMANSRAGTYQISTTFTPDSGETCVPVRALTETTQVNGSVSAASCNFNLPQRQDSSLFNIYSIHVAETGTVQISVPRATFTPLLLLLDKDGNAIVEDSESGGLYMPHIKQSLTAGDYSLLVFNEDSFDGDYTLQYSFSAGAATPCPVQNLEGGQPLTGTLVGDASCRFVGLLLDRYKFTIPSSATVDIGLSSGDFTTFLELRDSKDNFLGFSDQTSEVSSAHFKADLPAGTYFVYAASVDLPGSYTLNAQFTSKTIAPCAASQSLPINTGFVGRLGQGGCTGTAGDPVDYYRFTTTTDATAALIATSNQLDTNLTLTDAAGKVLRKDDNSYGQGDALIVQILKAGTYKVEVRGKNASGTNGYRLDLLWTAGGKPPLCTANSLSLGAVLNGILTYTACQYYDNTFADIYQFAVVDGTKPVNISATSAQFDSFLILMDAKGNVLSTDDNSAGGLDARLSTLLDPGNYYLVVKPAADPAESGRYQLTIQQ